MLLIYTYKITPRFTYIANHICKRLLGIEVAFTTEVSDFIKHEGPKLTYTKPTLTEPGGGGAGGEKLSPIEEGARLQLLVVTGGGSGSGGGGGLSGGAAAVRLADEAWMRVLRRVQYRLLFTSCGPQVVLREEGALRLRAG